MKRKIVQFYCATEHTLSKGQLSHDIRIASNIAYLAAVKSNIRTRTMNQQPPRDMPVSRKISEPVRSPARFCNAREDSRALAARSPYLIFNPSDSLHPLPPSLPPVIVGTSLRRLLLILRAVDSRSMERTVSKQPAVFRHAPLAVR